MQLPRPDFYIHLGWFDLPEVKEIAIANAPAFMQGLRVLFVSDVHLRTQAGNAKLEALISILEAQKADLILLGGDYGEQAEECKRFFLAFSRLKPRLGCFAVPGNNDREFFPDLEVLKALAADCGVKLMVNERHTLEIGGRLEIGGCDDHLRGNPETKNLFADETAYRILLSHFPVKPDCEPELMLSGHTHGGQFNFLGITPYAVGFEPQFKMEAVSGLKRIGKTTLLVSKGIGVSRLPLRAGVRPQVLLVKFTG